MPDSVVPIVRRPVRKTSITPQTEPKGPDTVSRKLSIGGESNDRLSPPKSTRSWIPSSSPSEERRRSLISDASSSSSQPAPVPSPVTSKKEYVEVKAVGGFPITKGDNLPALPIAKNRPIKTSVSVQSLILMFSTIYLKSPFIAPVRANMCFCLFYLRINALISPSSGVWSQQAEGKQSSVAWFFLRS